MLHRSLRRIVLLVGALAVASALSACSTTEPRLDRVGAEKADGPGDRTADEEDEGEDEHDGEDVPQDDGAGLQVVPGTEREAQELVDAAERKFLEEPSAEFEVWWIGGGEVETPIEGAFDAAQPATEVTLGMDEDNQYVMRLRGEDTWLRATVDGRSMDCWMHLTGGAVDGGPAGVPYQALLLFEPVALGRKVLTDGDRWSLENGYDRIGDRVVVELRLDEALPAVFPQPGGLAAKPLDPRARVRAVANVGVGGRYSSIEYDVADLFDALAASRGGVPEELRGLVAEPIMQDLQVEIRYHDYGSPVEVAAPPRAEVADFGSWSDLLAGIEDPAAREPGSAPSCDAALRGA
ncbi:hypothetical protein [Nocardioides humi]|uniref:Lipoprotein n=1 Tax=Nocardioides humi TaxID=449461 RepID=A0ABN2ALT1_9ACTN|nr:hypothetical protein [Nocardioides humi]